MRGFGRIISTVNVKDPSAAVSEALTSVASGADRAEIRVDALSRAGMGALEDLLGLAGRIPLLFSGNRVALSSREARILREASDRGAWIDIPFEKCADIPRWADRDRTVLSYHGAMADRGLAASILSSMKGRTALVKLVPPASNIAEAARFLSWIRELSGSCPLIAFPSGAESSAARILALAHGSGSVYAASDGSEPAAEGQMRLRDLLSYRPAEITGNTALYGLVGHPLLFSLSPGLWNGWFEELGMDARYLLFSASAMPEALEAFSLLGVRGFGVTSPYKERVIGSIGKLSNVSRKCRAVNTVFLGNGKSLGTNTDVFGIRQSLRSLKSGAAVLVLGSGGAARAAAFSLTSSNRVVISARSAAKGKALADDMGALFIEWERKHEREYDIIVNATSCGADGKEMPWEIDRPLGSKILFEMVTRQGKTPLEKKAEEEGLWVIRGSAMLFHQARLQFRILTGMKPPKESIEE